MNKKILWISLLIVFIIIIVLGVVCIKPISNNVTQNVDTFQKNTNIIVNNEEIDNKINNISSNNFEKIILDDGILYALNGEKVTSDIVVGTNYFDTTLTDMYLNPINYYNKNIEIEGMYLISGPYSFVGRFSESNLCPYCPVGYSYMEYQIECSLDEKLEDEKSWIKIIGTLQKANDETSNFQDYFYIKVLNLEIMNKRGQDTVIN